MGHVDVKLIGITYFTLTSTTLGKTGLNPIRLKVQTLRPRDN